MQFEIAYNQAAIFLKRHSFAPLNIGPFSELYLFYEEFVDLFENLINSYNESIENTSGKEEGATSQLSFLIDIVVHSSVDAKLFVPRTCISSPTSRLIGITLNEHSFFQIRDTVLLLLHEIGHYVRPFDRIKRNQLLLDICNKLATKHS